ncbi:MAG: TolB family protein [Ilumatobacteraceae bacterium]
MSRTSRASLGVRLTAIAAVLAASVAVVAQISDRAEAATPASASAFTPITPQRLVDTRIGLGVPLQRLQTATSMDVQVTGRLGIPSNATAVVANVTAVDASGPGYLQVLPTGRAAFGSSSTLNVDLVGQTIPNATFAPLGDGGRLTVYAIFTTDVVVDIFGYFTPAATSSAGRLVPLTPQRILDTRVGLGWTPPTPPAAPTSPGPSSPPGNPGDAKDCGDFATYQDSKAWFDTYFPFYGDVANLDSDDDGIPCETLPGHPNVFRTHAVGAATVISLQVAGRGGVPTSGVSAVVMNVTAVEPFGPGFVQVAPTPVVAGTSSNLNTAPGRTTANLVVVPLGPGGTVDLYTTSPADLLADVVGYFTDASAPISSVGLFVPISPDRQLDSRPGAAGPLPIGTITTIDVNDVANGAIAIAGNLTAVGPVQPGYLQVAAPPIAPGTSSNLNVAYAGQTVANAIVSPAAGGLVQLFNQTSTHELLDVTGWFTSAVASDPPVPTTQPPTTQPPTTPAPTTPTTPPPPLGPDGKIAFTRQNQIYTINPDGTGEVKLTSGDKNYTPRWSPDGSMIAYIHEVGGARNIWVMNADGSNKRKVSTTATAYGAAWSPDGLWLAYPEQEDGTLAYLVRTRVYPPYEWPEYYYGFVTGAPEERDLISVSGTPVWSPDGLRLSFYTQALPFNADHFIATYDIRSEQLSMVAAAGSGAAGPGAVYQPAYSPNGALMAFVRTDDDAVPVIKMVALATGSLEFDTQPQDEQPVFAPSGTKLALMNDSSGSPTIYIVNTDGTGRAPLTTGYEPSWQRIAA